MNSDILQAFFTAINDAGLGLPIAFEGKKFTPPDSGQWLELTMLPNDGIDKAMSNGSVLAQGILQVNVCDRPNTGILPLMQLSETVAALFPKNTIISGLVRSARQPYTSSVLQLDDRLMLPLSIVYSE